MAGLTRVSLGRADAFGELPALVNIGSRSYFLVTDHDGFQLLSTTCPHQGGTVMDVGDRFQCPVHNWRFDRATGQCLNAPSRALTKYPVTIEAGQLWVSVPAEPASMAPRDRAERTAAGLSIALHAHACMEISRGGFSLLTDPWLDGPAFLGSWAPWPVPFVKGPELHPNAILITHEHSDHFHEPTLKHFDRNVAVYVPDFPNQRMQRRLAELGFWNVHVLRFGERQFIAPDWSLTAFEPDSYWNDALILIDAGGFRLFDINDAGLNPRIARLVGHVDLLAVQFSAGASGYPWTWSHLTDAQKITISEQMCAGKLKLIREAATAYHADAVLPCASHFKLWRDDHVDYARMMRRNTLDDVKTAMQGAAARVIDLMPGDRWDAGASTIARGPSHEPRIDHHAFRAALPTDESLTRERLVSYLLRLNEVPEISHCEDLTVRMTGHARDPQHTLDVAFEVRGGTLSMLATPPARANLTMAMPLAVMTTIITRDLSWDEAFIGYWCDFDRHPNVYHAGFWRLFQAPYFMKRVRLDEVPPEPVTRVTANSIVAELLEAHGAAADRIMRRYGLYCLGCHHSTADTLSLAARHHGIAESRIDLLIEELNHAVGGPGHRDFGTP